MNSLADAKLPLNERIQISQKCSEPTQSGSKEIPDTATRFRDDEIVTAAWLRDDEIVTAAWLRDDGIIWLLPGYRTTVGVGSLTKIPSFLRKQESREQAG